MEGGFAAVSVGEIVKVVVDDVGLTVLLGADALALRIAVSLPAGFITLIYFGLNVVIVKLGARIGG